MEKLKNIKSSITFKILLTTILTGIIINIVLMQFFRIQFSENHDFFIRNSMNYAQYLIDDYEKNYDREFLHRTGRRFGVIIEPIKVSSLKSVQIRKHDEIIHKSPNTIILRNRGRIWGIIKNSSNNYYKVSYRGRPPITSDDITFIFLLGIVTLIFIVAYLYIRSLLKPLKFLNKGIDIISLGNMEYEVPVFRNDDIGKLTSSFNRMNRKIRAMIKSKDQLMIDISHELRTPLTRIKLALAMLDENKLNKSISDDINELEEMINEILETARGESNIENLKISDFSNEDLIYKSLQKAKIPNSVVSFNISQTFTIQADLKKMITVIKNILDNSIKYCTDENLKIKIESGIINNKEYISIKDNGPGVNDEDLNNIFEPFYRADKSRNKKTSGFGLGLSMCKKIIDSHNFSIKAYNGNDGGLEIKIEF